jgi:hypothetical protein
MLSLPRVHCNGKKPATAGLGGKLTFKTIA